LTQTKILNAQPGQQITILVRAVQTTDSGATIYSDYASLPYTVPQVDANGNVFGATNSASNVQLKGGSIYAGKFTGAVGNFDPLVNTTTGSGVILNQYGLAGYASGTKQFYIDSRTGNATFSGTVTATILESNSYSGVTDGSTYSTTGTAFNLKNGSITSKNFRIDTSGNAYFAGSITANATINGVSASTVVSNAQLGAASSTYAFSAVQPGNFVSVNASNQIQTIDTRGVTLTTNGTSYPAVQINSYGLFAWDSGGNPTVQILSQSYGGNAAGSAIFKGQVTATSGYIGNGTSGWQINSTNIASVNGTMVLNATTGTIQGGSIVGTTLTSGTGSNYVYVEEFTIGSTNVGKVSFVTNNSESTGIYDASGQFFITRPDGSVLSLSSSVSQFANGTNELTIGGTYLKRAYLTYSSPSSMTDYYGNSIGGLRNITVVSSSAGAPSGYDGDIYVTY